MGHIILTDIKFCNDTDPIAQYVNAQRQHNDLINLLKSKRPDCDVELVTILIGHTGSIYNKYTTEPLSKLGLDTGNINRICNRIHKIVVQSVTSIIRKRRDLERIQPDMYKYLEARRKRKRTEEHAYSIQEGDHFLYYKRKCRHSSGVT